MALQAAVEHLSYDLWNKSICFHCLLDVAYGHLHSETYQDLRHFIGFARPHLFALFSVTIIWQ